MDELIVVLEYSYGRSIITFSYTKFQSNILFWISSMFCDAPWSWQSETYSNNSFYDQKQVESVGFYFLMFQMFGHINLFTWFRRLVVLTIVRHAFQ